MTDQFSTPVPLLRRATLTLAALFVFGLSFAGSPIAAPNLSYTSPQVYTTNAAITLLPTNTGGVVPATVPGIVTIAGSATIGHDNGIGVQATFNSPHGVAVDASRNVYVADMGRHNIRKINPVGDVSNFAGDFGLDVGAYQDGIYAKFNNPSGVAVNAAGNVYVADRENNRIRKIAAGTVSTFAGTGTAGAVDGIGSAASFNAPSGIAIDATGNLYVADRANNKIRKITSAGVVSTFAGSGTAGAADGTGTAASFNSPQGVAVDASGNVYVADDGNHKIRKITPAGVVSTLAGSGTAGSADGTSSAASFKNPIGIAVDAVGNVYVADFGNNKIRKITPAGVVSTIAGSIAPPFLPDGTTSTDGSLTSATFTAPAGVAIDNDNNVYVAEASYFSSHKIRKISLYGYTISPTLPAGLSFDATTGAISGTPTAAIVATDYTITATNAAGVSTTIVRITVNTVAPGTAPTVTTQAVTAISRISATGNGNITALGSAYPTAYGVCWNTTGTPTTANSKTNKGAISATGAFTADMIGLTAGTTYKVRAFATNSFNTVYGEEVTFTTPAALVTAPAPAIAYATPQVYTANTAINPLLPTSTGGAIPATAQGVSTFAGRGTAGSANDIGSRASFYKPRGVVVDATGNVYVADDWNHLIRKITPAGFVSTFAGSGQGSADGTGTAASFNSPRAVALDAAGNVYVADYISNKIRKITSAGVVSTFAGSGDTGYRDGAANFAQFYSPSGLAVDVEGNVYVADAVNNKIRKITSAGVVSTFAGSGTAGSADGTGTAASFNLPSGLDLDDEGNVYVADAANNKIRKITSAGVVSTFAGSGTAGSADGTGSAASFNYPTGVAIDAAGNVYVADLSNNKIRKITPAGVVSTLAGNGTAGSTEGNLSTSEFSSPYGLALDAVGNVYVGDEINNKIRRISPYGYSISPALPAGLIFDGTTGTISGTPTVAAVATNYTITATNDGGIDAAIVNITVNAPPTVTTQAVTAIAQTTATGNGSITALGTSNPTAYGVCWSTTGTPTTANSKTDKGAISATGAFTAAMTGLLEDKTYKVRAFATNSFGTSYGELFVFTTLKTPPSISYETPKVYTTYTAITSLSPTNTGGSVPAAVPGVSTFAGSATADFANGTGTAARFNYPHDVAVDAAGNVYVADRDNHRIRKITPAGVVSTFAGSGNAGYLDGTGTAAEFNSPEGVAVDAAGNVYVADTRNQRIRKITPARVVTTIAGNEVYGSIDGIGTLASIVDPRKLAVDDEGNVYFTESGKHKIRKITSAGVVSTFVGSGSPGSTDGTGTGASFRYPSGVAVDALGNVYVIDNGNYKIRKVTSAGVVSTFAGSGIDGFADGIGTAARFRELSGIAVDAAGNVYVADAGNNRIRKITSAGIVSTLAGSTTSGSEDGLLSSATFAYLKSLALDNDNNVYVSDNFNKIRKITLTGYTISPALPAGLSFDGTTGTISGRPTETKVATDYTITAANKGGSNAAIVRISVNDAANISAPTAQATHLIFSSTGTDPYNIVLKYNASATAQKYLVVRKANTAPTFVPVDGTVYTTGAQGADQIVYVGLDTTFVDLNMTAGSYFYAVYAYNLSTTVTKYLTASPLVGSTKLTLDNSLSLSAAAGQTSAANFISAGVSVNFADGTTGTNLTVTKTNEAPVSNLSGLPGVKGLSNVYFTVTSDNPTPGNYSIIIDFSMLNLTQAQWAKFKVLKRNNATTAWTDVTTIGGTIVNRQTDGVWGKITISGLSSFSEFVGLLEPTTFTVTSALEDVDESGTLNFIIANAYSGDIITFDVSAMGTNKIMLTSPVEVTKNLTIIGAAGGVILDGSSSTFIMLIANAVVELENLTIQNGHNDYTGGIFNIGVLTMTNCVISDNEGALAGGILQYSDNNNQLLTLVNCTVTNNNLLTNEYGGAGGITVFNGVANIYNSIIQGNTGPGDTDVSPSSVLAKVYNSCIGNLSAITVTEGTGNIDTNPLFVGSTINATHPYSLYGNSPCKNTGSNMYSFNLMDIRNQSRIQNTTIDMGAYEWTSGVDSNGLSTTIDTGNTSKIHLYSVNQKIVLVGADDAQVAVYNHLGQQLFAGKVTNGLINRTFAKGIYIVKVNNEVQKVFVR